MKNCILSFFLMFLGAKYFACSCNNKPSFYWHYNYAEKVFKGKVISIQSIPDMRSVSIQFQVIKNYKGTMTNDTVSIKTGLGHGDCGLHVDTNDVWIIFAEKGYTNICSFNFLIEQTKKETKLNLKGIYDNKIFIKSLEEIATLESRYIKEYNSKKGLISEGFLSKGVAQGYWIYHFEPNENWPTKEKIFYRNGIKDSVEFEYYKNGKIYREQVWKDGQQDGKEVFYFENGETKISRSFSNNEKDGEWKMYFENKALREVEYYSNGKSLGTHISFFENGDTNSVSYYNDEGKRTKCIGKYENGNMQWIWIYTYSDSSYVDNWIQYYENGKIRIKGTTYFSSNQKHKSDGELISYYENGNIKERKTYDMGKEVGVWEYYDESGKLTKTENK